MDQGEDTSGIGSAKEQADAEGEAMEDFLKTKIGRGLSREDMKSITKKLEKLMEELLRLIMW